MKRDILEKLNKLNNINKFSLGLHTTSKDNAISIVNFGLMETKCRAIEGTVSFKGPMEGVTERDLDFFFPYTDATVIVAVPSQFNVPRIEDNLGGNKPLCEFSKFMELATIMRDQFPGFSYDKNGMGMALIPTELIVGYYDKDYNLTINEDCMLFDEDASEKFDTLKHQFEIASMFYDFDM